jgi:biotin transport system substrate-specific component
MSQTSGYTRELTAAALLAALLAVTSVIVIPLGPVPITLQVFVVVLIALLLRPVWALAATGVYVLLGAVGVPVFAGMTGGIGHLLGPTGGYLFGFMLGACIGSVIRVSLQLRVPRLTADVLAAVATVLAIYVLGVTQLFVISHLGAKTGMSIGQAVVVGAAPFLVPDLIKAAVAVVVAEMLRRTGVVPGARGAAATVR